MYAKRVEAGLAGGRPIVVVGSPRSGTTMLQLMLHAHPRIAIPPETRFVLRAYDRRHHFGDLAHPVNRHRLGEFIVGPGNSFGDLGLDRDHVVEAVTAGGVTLGSAATIVLRAYAARFGKARWGDKRPAYLLNLDILLWMFPNAQILHIVRDGRDCVASAKDQPWHPGGVNHAIFQWRRGMEAARRAARRLRPDQYAEVSYEALVADPAGELTRICDFVEEDYAPAMTEPFRLARIAVPHRKTWHALTHYPVTTGRVGSWQWRLTAPEIALCESLMGRRLVERGYALSNPGPATAPSYFSYLQHAARIRCRRSRRAARVALDRIRGSEHYAAR